MSTAAAKPRPFRIRPWAPPPAPRMPYFHGDTMADGMVYTAQKDVFLGWLEFLGAASFADHLAGYGRRVHFLTRSKRIAKVTRPNKLAKLLFPKGEPRTMRDWNDARTRIERRHAVGQCVACSVPMPPQFGGQWICVGCAS